MAHNTVTDSARRSRIQSPRVFISREDAEPLDMDVYEIWTDKTGRRFEMRAVKPEDKELVEAAFKKLSTDSIQQRFFTFKTELSCEDLHDLVEVDMCTSFTCVVTTTPDEAQLAAGFTEQIAGIGQYMRSSHKRSEAEIAFLVVDEFQGKGISTRMLKELMKAACEHGIKKLIAITTATNVGMHRLLTHHADDVTVERDGSDMVLIIHVPEDKNAHAPLPMLSPLLSAAHSTRRLLTRKATRFDSALDDLSGLDLQGSTGTENKGGPLPAFAWGLGSAQVSPNSEARHLDMAEKSSLDFKHTYSESHDSAASVASKPTTPPQNGTKQPPPGRISTPWDDDDGYY